MGSQIIEVRLAELRQLFNAMDPSPFRDQDLDPRAEAFIVEWARATSTRRALRALFRRGRISLLIALVFLGASMAVGDVIVRVTESGFATLLREGLLIGAWVAMWRPLEVFLYDWWPIRAERDLLRRLSTIPVRIEYADTARTAAWQSDWPAKRAADRVEAPS